MEQVREQELAHALRRLGHLSEADREAVDHLTQALMNKFLHEPSVRLRAAAGNGRGLMRPRVPGVQWDHGAMGQATWTGVRLRDLLLLRRSRGPILACVARGGANRAR